MKKIYRLKGIMSGKYELYLPQEAYNDLQEESKEMYERFTVVEGPAYSSEEVLNLLLEYHDYVIQRNGPYLGLLNFWKRFKKE